ncbi:hypothetical protein GCM10009007_08970 [Formosimonas limnophila]|uniref:AAA+ ATPase domain-containing protein n=1 Tax=Formosimonas limnophila TaxID=1384487 RepID=A0A8J3CM69_9BURK|nr:ATP-binding protein [Formosimonas limnophila]GHA70431.1 hypothetical protein GCM10009007_08970 [Formosimonas limnophila]
MYIQSVDIKKCRILENVVLRFQTPNDITAQTNGNVINIIAGVNGCGKTSVLRAIYEEFNTPWNTRESIIEFDAFSLNGQFLKHDKKLNVFGQFWHRQRQSIDKGEAKLSDEKLIFLPSQQSFDFQPQAQLELKYVFAQEVNKRTLLGNAEFYIKEYVLGLERKSDIADPKARTRAAINEFNSHFLDADLLTQLDDLSAEQFNRPLFKNVAGERVTIDQLSDGEKQLYARVIALMMLQPQDSIILIDEPEIALHPAWQQKIMSIYANIGQNNQFIIATHSPQIIASVPYQNLILLRKNPETRQIEAVHCDQPPTGVDVNSILSEVMGAEAQPKKLTDLYRQYREFVENKEEHSPQALQIKSELLKLESPESAFMQEMQFLIDLRED